MKFCQHCGSQVKKKKIDGPTRFVCINSQCGSIDWNNPTPVVAALVKVDDQYLLARNVRWPTGIFSLITGYLEAGEDVESAVLREVKEELNLNGRIRNFLGHHVFREKNQLILAFEVEASGSVRLNEELEEIKWLGKDDLLRYDFGQLYVTKAVIEKWMGTIE